jgi:hypothetical protein
MIIYGPFSIRSISDLKSLLGVEGAMLSGCGSLFNIDKILAVSWVCCAVACSIYGSGVRVSALLLLLFLNGLLKISTS